MDSYFTGQFSVSQGREIDLSPNELKVVRIYYKFENVLGNQYLFKKEISENNYKFFITHPYIYLVCEFRRVGAEFYTPDKYNLTCKVKTGNEEYNIQLFENKSYGKYIGYNYEGDDALVVFAIDASQFKGVDEIISFTPTIKSGSGEVSKELIISDGQMLKNLCWKKNNLNKLTYSDGPQPTPQPTALYIQNWYSSENDPSTSLYSYYADASISYKYYNSGFYFSFNQDSYLSDNKITPDFLYFYYDNNSKKQVSFVPNSNSFRKIQVPWPNQSTIKQVTAVFQTTGFKLVTSSDGSGSLQKQSVTYTKEIVLKSGFEFKHYNLSLGDLKFLGDFKVKEIQGIVENTITLSSYIKGTVTIPDDFPYKPSSSSNDFILQWTDENSSLKNTEITISGNKIAINVSQILTITKQQDNTLTISYSDNNGYHLFKNGNYEIVGSFINRFLSKTESARTSFTPTDLSYEEQDKYILCSGIEYKLFGSYEENHQDKDEQISGDVLLPDEKVQIIFDESLKNQLISTETLNFVSDLGNNAEISGLNQYIIKYDQKKNSYTQQDAVESDENNFLNYTDLNPSDENKTYFISINPQLKINEKPIYTYDKKITIGRLVNAQLKESFQPRLEGKILKYSFSEYGGDKNDEYSAETFINKRIDNTEYFSLSRYSDTINPYEILTLTFKKSGSSNSQDVFFNIDVIANDDEKLEQLLNSFKEGVVGELDLADYIDANISWSSIIGQTIDIEGTYYYEKGSYIKTLFTFSLIGITVTAGTPSLGLRKNGIIVSPIETNEDLPSGTAQRINLKSNIDSSNNIRGNAVEIVLCDAAGNILKDSNENEIKCAISYEGTKSNNGENEYTSGRFLFNGVDLSGLNTTVNNSSTGLVKKVNDNKTAIETNASNIAVHNSKITALEGRPQNNSFIQYASVDYSNHDPGAGLIVNKDDQTISTSISVPQIVEDSLDQCFIYQTSGTVVWKSGNEENKSDLKRLKSTNITIDTTNKTINFVFTFDVRVRTELVNAGIWTFIGKIVCLHIPNVFSPDSLSFDSFSSDEIIEVIPDETENLDSSGTGEENLTTP